MAHYKIYTLKEFRKILKNNGYVLKRYSGDHEIYEHVDTHVTLSISVKVNPMICRRLIKENNLHIDA